MTHSSTIVVRALKTHPPTFEVLYVNAALISESNLKAGEVLSDSDLDYLFDAFGDFGVEVIYERKPCREKELESDWPIHRLCQTVS